MPSLCRLVTGISGDGTGLQAHMFVTGQAVTDWVRHMLDEAGPHENKFQITHTDERMGACVVVTQETGRNHFRQWENQLVAYIPGDFEGQWKIVGCYLRDS